MLANHTMKQLIAAFLFGLSLAGCGTISTAVAVTSTAVGVATTVAGVAVDGAVLAGKAVVKTGEVVVDATTGPARK